MWYNEIEIGKYESHTVEEIFDILVSSLGQNDIAEFAYKLLGWTGKIDSVLEPFDYEMDV